MRNPRSLLNTGVQTNCSIRIENGGQVEEFSGYLLNVPGQYYGSKDLHVGFEVDGVHVSEVTVLPNGILSYTDPDTHQVTQVKLPIAPAMVGL